MASLFLVTLLSGVKYLKKKEIEGKMPGNRCGKIAKWKQRKEKRNPTTLKSVNLITAIQ